MNHVVQPAMAVGTTRNVACTGPIVSAVAAVERSLAEAYEAGDELALRRLHAALSLLTAATAPGGAAFSR